jgi:hypothetical protein
MAGPQ